MNSNADFLEIFLLQLDFQQTSLSSPDKKMNKYTTGRAVSVADTTATNTQATVAQVRQEEAEVQVGKVRLMFVSLFGFVLRAVSERTRPGRKYEGGRKKKTRCLRRKHLIWTFFRSDLSVLWQNESSGAR